MFDLIPGQQPVKELFARALRDGTLGHAYLLGGPEGLAKTAFAHELAIALVASCGGCGQCDECDRARRGVHPDLHVLEREGDRIRIEQIAPIIEELALRPFAAARRVWVIPEVEQLTPEAANKLLKSIEEPPAHVYFLLVTDRFERVLPTIVSRCQLVEFRPVSDEEVLAYLEREFGLMGAQGEALARLSAGSVRAGGATRRRRARPRPPHAVPAARRGGALGRGREVRRRGAERLRQRAHGASRADQGRGGGAPRCSPRASWRDSSRTPGTGRWHVKRAEALAKREEARLRRLAATDAADAAAAWTRDLWVVACGASDVLWDCDRGDELAAAAVAGPEHYRRLLEVTAATRKDLYLNIDFELAFRAMFSRFEEVAESA